MVKGFNNQLFIRGWRLLKPWLTAVVLILILRYTGALSGISFFTQRAMMETGAFDYTPVESAGERGFDYDFTVKDLDGRQVPMDSFKNKVVFLNLWATWCGPCRVEMPSIQGLYEKVNHDSVAFVMLSVDKPEHHEKVKQFIAKEGYSFPVYTVASNLPAQLHTGSIPSTFVIRKDGKIAGQKIGATNFDTDNFLEFLIKLSLR